MEEITSQVKINAHISTGYFKTGAYRLSITYHPEPRRLKVIAMLMEDGWDVAKGYKIIHELHPGLRTGTSYFRVYKE